MEVHETVRERHRNLEKQSAGTPSIIFYQAAIRDSLARIIPVMWGNIEVSLADRVCRLVYCPTVSSWRGRLMGDNRSIELPNSLDREKAKPVRRVAIYLGTRLVVDRDVIGFQIGQC